MSTNTPKKRFSSSKKHKNNYNCVISRKEFVIKEIVLLSVPKLNIRITNIRSTIYADRCKLNRLDLHGNQKRNNIIIQPILFISFRFSERESSSFRFE